jgi:hypothetical protein
MFTEFSSFTEFVTQGNLRNEVRNRISWLKDQLNRELNVPRPAAAQERIADTDVRRDRDR